MSERPTSDSRRPFLLLMGAIGVLIVLGLALLVTVVILQRAEPRRHGPARVTVGQAAISANPRFGRFAGESALP